MKAAPPDHQSFLNTRVIQVVAVVVIALALALKANNWVHTGVIEWGPALSMSGMLILMTTGACNVPRGALRLCLSIAGVLSIAWGSVIVFTH